MENQTNITINMTINMTINNGPEAPKEPEESKWIRLLKEILRFFGVKV